MHSEPLISIIVPVYGVEQFIDKCVESMLSQTYGNLQVILVDDESPDESPQKCDYWAEKDPRVEAIHIHNQGVSVARNIAMDHVRGEYVAFVDADDFIDVDMIERMVDSAERNNSQIVFCGNTRELYAGDGSYRAIGHGEELSFDVQSNAEFRKCFVKLSDMSYTRPVWNKLYSYAFLHKFAKPFSTEVTAGSDAIFNYALYPYAERVSCIAASPYHYVTREGSIAGKYNPRLFQSRKYGYRFIRPILEGWCPDALDGFDNLFLAEMDLVPIYLYADSHYSSQERRDILRNLMQDYEVIESLKHIHPRGMRNTVSRLILSSGDVWLIAAYGSCVNKLKHTVRLLARK